VLKIFCSPARYVQGRDASRELAREMVKMGIGARPLIIASPTARHQTEPLWIEAFGAEKISFDVIEFGR
jgi:glycerol dehydrogenase